MPLLYTGDDLALFVGLGAVLRVDFQEGGRERVLALAGAAAAVHRCGVWCIAALCVWCIAAASLRVGVLAQRWRAGVGVVGGGCGPL